MTEIDGDDAHDDASAREDVRAELRAWIATHWDPERPLAEWREDLVASGWAAPSWPERWLGRGLPAWSDAIVSDELARADAVGVPAGIASILAATTIMEHGSDELRDRFLRPILTGADTWCQLFSEPGAGSDLAGLTAGAVLDGERWIVNGQKLWNTSAHHADYGLLVARTDWDAPKHRGITYFVLPMKQHGVEVRPLRQMNYYSSFNEVFMADAEIPAEFVLGVINGGWTVAQTTLAAERRIAARFPAFPKGGGRTRTAALAELTEFLETYKWYPQRVGRADLAVEHARAVGRTDDAVVRQELARLHSMQRTSEWRAARARAARAAGRPGGQEGSIAKLATSNIARQASLTHSMISTAQGMLRQSDGAFDGTIAEVFISVPAQSIAGGTDEIQKNILGEKVLGLPREPSVDHDLPFRNVPHN